MIEFRTLMKNHIAPRTASAVTSQFGWHSRGLNLMGDVSCVCRPVFAAVCVQCTVPVDGLEQHDRNGIVQHALAENHRIPGRPRSDTVATSARRTLVIRKA
jgi:hypothetical protein